MSRPALVVHQGHPPAAALEGMASRTFANKIDIKQLLEVTATAHQVGVVDKDDIVQNTYFTILKAAFLFDETRGTDPNAYLARAVWNGARIQNRVERRYWAGRNETNAASTEDTPLEAVPDDQEAIDDVLGRSDEATHVGRWMATLPANLRMVAKLLYEDDLTQREAAAEMGISHVRVGQLHRRLLELGRVHLAFLRN
jgi:RNA polymerase sigma factor (sigma-70 family)